MVAVGWSEIGRIDSDGADNMDVGKVLKSDRRLVDRLSAVRLAVNREQRRNEGDGQFLSLRQHRQKLGGGDGGGTQFANHHATGIIGQLRGLDRRSTSAET